MASSGVAESGNPPDNGAQGRIGKGTVICAGALVNSEPQFEDNSVIEINEGQDVNVTFPTLPTNVQPPFNVTLSVFSPNGWKTCNAGLEVIPNTINQSWFMFDSTPFVPYNKTGGSPDTVGGPGDTFIFDIHQPIPGYDNARVSFWISPNYTVIDPNNGAGSSTLAPMAAVQFLPTFLLVALFFLGLSH